MINDMTKDFHISIFTAAYNRAKLLNRLFESLLLQSYQNFEWIIVDDGSTDGTEAVVKKFQQADTKFKIRYKKQQNQGKHIAINNGLSEANGDYFYIVDSDDRLPKNALKIINKKVNLIHDQQDIAGIVGLKCFFGGEVVGSNFLEKDLICDLFEYRYKHKHKGDRAEVIKTSVFSNFLFPQYLNENFVPESIVWNRLAKEYKLLYFSENIYECEYLVDGLSSKSIQLRGKNPIGILNLYSELANTSNLSFKIKLKSFINFWRFYFAKPLSKEQKSLIPKASWPSLFLIPIGYLYSLKDRLKN